VVCIFVEFSYLGVSKARSLKLKGYRDKPLSEEEQARNKVISVTRAGGECSFVTYKRHYGFGGTRFMGLAKNATAYGLVAMAANMRKGAKF